MMNVRKIALIPALATLVIAGCGASSAPKAAEKAPAEKQAEAEIVTGVTKWQKDDAPGNGTRNYRIVTINTPSGVQLCALQWDGGSYDSGTGFTILDGNVCKKR